MALRRRGLPLTVGILCVGVGTLGWILYRPMPGPGDAGSGAPFAIWGAVAILAVGLGRPGLFQVGPPNIGLPLALALSGPAALLPLAAFHDRSAIVAVAILWPLSALPLGIALAGPLRLPNPVALAAVAATGLAGVLGAAATLVDSDWSATLLDLRLGAISAIGLLPALAVAASASDDLLRHQATSGATAVRAGTVVAGLAPLAGASVLVVPAVGMAVLGSAVLAFVVVSRWTVRPLAWAAAQAAAQRDLTVAMVEAERRRLAADLHDGPLQSLLLLGRRLEQDGDRDGAGVARSIAAELRDLAGELRLPILDDLGVGPALDWLAGRIRLMTGLEIDVEYEGLNRAPPEVELAAFRIAQEALSNAVRHGQPPIRVSYRTTGDSVILSIDDRGAGFTDALIGATADGRYGLLNMRQRAEQIGARLELGGRPGHGTHVGIEWHATPA